MARRANAFAARGDVDTVTQIAITLDHHVAKMDPDAERDAPFGWQPALRSTRSFCTSMARCSTTLWKGRRRRLCPARRFGRKVGRRAPRKKLWPPKVPNVVVELATNRRYQQLPLLEGVLMHRLIYKSIETVVFTDAELKRLLWSSRLRNAEAGVTGMLIYDRGTFLQALEGEAASMYSIFSRIEQDYRHSDIAILLWDRAAGSRAFGQCSMGYADGSGLGAMLKGVVNLLDAPGVAKLARSSAVKVLDAAASTWAA